ncbi:SLC13 family permease [Clostridium sp. SM-530-WT-3G]|uniref:GntP family permease n=1 Tax=Clostridium sp. SM-530-WT-3G TaxID=2725303 RepID=UPI00145D341F|nr:SLC13 family permease [Clostridium sp. SM-530-WT-3G]NME84143.1 GntP family permease [Clostridium sp. SM-530-WT-3G]
MEIIHWSGALIGLAIAIILILIKLNPVYALFTGAIIGGVIGGASLSDTVSIIIDGTKSVMGAVVRILAAGVLAGILIESGAAERIAETIVEKLGEKKAILSLALACFIITAVGVFITVSIIIVAPIALTVAKKSKLTRPSILLAMIGGGKAGNIISPNPNTISVAKGFNVDLAQVMIGGFIPAVLGLIATYFVATYLKRKGDMIGENEGVKQEVKDKPSFSRSIVAPIVAIILLGASPLGSILNIGFLERIKIDSMIILPVAGIIGLAAMGKLNKILEYTASGLNKMTGTAIILIGAGAIAGIISNSNLSSVVVELIDKSGISGVLLAPLSGILMAAATASTSTGVIVASGSFGDAILSMGIAPLNAAVMMHAGGVVLDQLPHGNFFLITADAVNMDIKDRLKLIIYEAIVGGVMVITATILYGYLKF